MKLFIILSPIKSNDRKASNLAENQTYKTVQEYIDTIPGKNRVIMDLNNFIEECNDEAIKFNDYWISYINVEEHEKTTNCDSRLK